MNALRKVVRRSGTALAAGVLLALAAAAGAEAQQMSTSSSSFNAGYGRRAGEENAPVDFSIRDANGNLAIIDGVMSTGRDQSTLAGSSISDGSSYAGVGGLYASSASAIGNNLTVVTSGSYNTVIVNSTQTNNGNVVANGNINTQVAGAN
jgi:holdfast attachment protein HfaA